ncbi:hypothetical protein HY629_02915 [Candidatus Uhrbacteria bacterium]|nr:hypothetical protein [Candidatus Uhrbacteria bacterium]
MYHYIYDTFLAQRSYRETLARLETRLTDLGINGKIGRLTMLQNIRELIREGVRKGSRTIVVCGNDTTIFRALTTIIDEGVALGIVPFGEPSTVAAALGIPHGVAAAETLSERLLKRLDVGIVNDTAYFLRDCTASLPQVPLECNQQYRLTPLGRTLDLTITNLPSGTGASLHSSSPVDGILDTFIAHRSFLRKGTPETYIPTTHLTIPSERPFPLTLDGWNTVTTPATIEVMPQLLRVIVGKKRNF